MRKLKLQVQMSVDGFVGGPNGEMDWLTANWDDDLKSYITEITDPVDCIVMGRKLAQGFIPHWASHPEIEGADKINQTAKVVFTQTLQTCDWPNTVLATGDLAGEIAQLKAQPGGDIIVYGGATFVANLIAAGLVDELHLFVNPVALGAGMPVFQNLAAKQNLSLKHSKAFSNGVVLLCYGAKNLDRAVNGPS